MAKSIRRGVFGTVANTYTHVNIGERLRDIRKENRYTIKDLADKLDTKEDVIQAWEDGLSLPADKFVKKLSELYNVKKEYLLGLDD